MCIYKWHELHIISYSISIYYTQIYDIIYIYLNDIIYPVYIIWKKHIYIYIYIIIYDTLYIHKILYVLYI